MRMAGWRLNPIHFAAACLVAVSCISARGQYDLPKPDEAAVATLRRAVTKQPDGSHVPLVFALRQLRDPDLKPLFYQLAQSGDGQSQVQAVLALAEIDPTKKVDVWLISQIQDQAQEMVIANALDLEMISPQQIEQILSQDSLNPMARLMLMAEQLLAGQSNIDANELDVLSKSEDEYVAGFASILLAQLGQPAQWTAYQKTIEAQKLNSRTRLTLWLLDAIGRYKITKFSDWVRAQGTASDADEAVTFRAVYAMLQMDPAAGLDLWSKAVGDKPSAGTQARYALTLLAVSEDLPPQAFDRLRVAGADSLVLDMAEAGTAVASDTDPSASLIALLKTGHLKTTDWVMTAVEDLKPEHAAKVYKFLIEQVDVSTSAQTDPVGLATKSVAKLVEIDPSWVLERLRAAEDDSVLQQTLLLGMFQSDSPLVGEAAAQVRRIGSGRADSLALLLIAKHAKSLDPEDLKKLGTIASGGGQVSDVLQVQAAWFYIKHTNNIQTALGSIFTK